MGRCYLQPTGAKRHINIAVFDERNFPVHQREHNSFRFKIAIALIIRMNGNSCIAQHGFRPGCGNHNGTFTFYKRIADMIEVTVSFFVFDLKVRQGRMTAMAPVDDVIILIDKAFIVKLHKDLAHRARQAFIHGETFTFPIT